MSAMLDGGVGAVKFSLLNVLSKCERRRQCARWVLSIVLGFLDGIVAFFSLHSNTKVDSTAAASESSASTRCWCCNVSIKRTTLAGFRAARDIAMLLVTSKQREYKGEAATLRV